MYSHGRICVFKIGKGWGGGGGTPVVKYISWVTEHFNNPKSVISAKFWELSKLKKGAKMHIAGEHCDGRRFQRKLSKTN